MASLVALYPSTAIMEKQYRSSLKQYKKSNYIIQQSHYWVYSQRKFNQYVEEESHVYWNTVHKDLEMQTTLLSSS